MHLLILIVLLVLLMALVIGGILHSASQADRDIEAMDIEDFNRASEIEVRDYLNRREPQNDVPHSGAGSEQNPQPALATSSTVPGNVRAAVEKLSASEMKCATASGGGSCSATNLNAKASVSQEKAPSKVAGQPINPMMAFPKSAGDGNDLSSDARLQGREFQNWGPLGANGKPMKSRKGETFNAFLNALRSLGFNVEARVLNAADYGDPTSRHRLIVMARRGKPVVWPDVTHGKSGDLFGLKPYRTAREIIDWSVKGKSIFRRSKPLSPNTVWRIAAAKNPTNGEEA